MNSKPISEILRSFAGIRVGVIGDLMLDVYVHGTVDRISPEAPVPIIHITSEERVLGGAANVAQNVVSLGGKVKLLGVVGDDVPGSQLAELCHQQDIDAELVTDKERKTTEKRRVVSMTQQILRIDSEDTSVIDSELEENMISKLDAFVDTVDVVCVADYAKGIMSPKVIDSLIVTAKKYNKKLVVDAKPRNMLLYKDVDILTPNRSEVMNVSGLEDPTQALHFVRSETQSPVLMTCGADGMELAVDTEKTIHIKSIDVEVVDVSGAGDTVTAATALLRALGVGYEETAKIAAHAASVVVSKVKTATVNQTELLESLSRS